MTLKETYDNRKAQNLAKCEMTLNALKSGKISISELEYPSGGANMYDLRIRKTWFMADTNRITEYFASHDLVTTEQNSKLGSIATVNQPAVVTCKPNVPCKDWCYARKGHWAFANLQLANWLRYMFYKLFPKKYFETISEFIAKGLPTPWFRWHSSGDIVDKNYLKGMCRIARKYPNVKFLAFTKKYELVNDYEGRIPNNLRIVFSHCPGLPMPNPKHFPVVYVSGVGEDSVIPSESVPCSGHCEGCFTCWLVDKGESVVIKKH